MSASQIKTIWNWEFKLIQSLQDNKPETPADLQDIRRRYEQEARLEFGGISVAGKGSRAVASTKMNEGNAKP